MVDAKRCTLCGEIKPLDEFYRRPGRGPEARVSRCRACHVKMVQEWNRKNPERVNARNRRENLELKVETLTAYSDVSYPRCACCGETPLVFLTLDHVADDGRPHRQEVGQGQVYRDLRRRGYPDKGKYQVLCFNCNRAKAVLGECPHRTGTVTSPS